MKKIKFTVFGLIGIAVLTTGLISCDNDVVSSNEETTESTLKAKFGDMAYQDFYLGQVTDDNVQMRLDPGPLFKDCFNLPSDCLPDLIIIVPGKVELYQTLINQPSNYVAIFNDNQDLLLEDIHPILVNGVLDNFFKLDIVAAESSGVHKFQFRRISDNELVGTYPIILN